MYHRTSVLYHFCFKMQLLFIILRRSRFFFSLYNNYFKLIQNRFCIFISLFCVVLSRVEMSRDLVLTDRTLPGLKNCQFIETFHTDNILAGKLYGSLSDLALTSFTILLSSVIHINISAHNSENLGNCFIFARKMKNFKGKNI